MEIERKSKLKGKHEKRRVFLLMTGLLFARYGWSQQSLSLDSCRERVLEHNHEVIMSDHKKDETRELYKSARTQFLPRISANAIYTYLNKPLSYDISTPEINIPVGSMGADGQWTITPEDTRNTWVAMGDSYVPLDASGQAFDPGEEPEKLLISDWANIPAIDTTLTMGQHHNVLGGVSITQPIYMGGKVRQSVKIAEYACNMAEAALQGTKADVIYNSDEAYYRIQTLEEKCRLARSAVELLETLLTDLENYQSEGLIKMNDLMKARVKLNEAELNLQKAQNGLKLSRMVLNQMMGEDLHAEFLLTDSIGDQMLFPRRDDYQSQALQNRYELKALGEQEKIEESKIKIAESLYLPNVVASANYYMISPNPYDSFKDNLGTDWNMALVCNIPIFHWNDRVHTVRAAKIARESSAVKMDQAGELISLQVEQAIIYCEESANTIMLAEKNLEQAEENLRIHRDNLSEGMATVADVLEAEVMWQKALEELINARAKNQMAFINLEKVSGTLIK
jgi:outer membrane protein